MHKRFDVLGIGGRAADQDRNRLRAFAGFVFSDLLELNYVRVARVWGFPVV
jgi:hypothetical protein